MPLWQGRVLCKGGCCYSDLVCIMTRSQEKVQMKAKKVVGVNLSGFCLFNVVPDFQGPGQMPPSLGTTESRFSTAGQRQPSFFERPAFKLGPWLESWNLDFRGVPMVP